MKGEYQIPYCVMDKVCVLSDVFAIFLIMYQLFIVYLYCHKIKCRDWRISILCICFYSSLYTFFHYNIIDFLDRPKFFFVIEFNRYLIMFCLCMYYCDKASHLLPKRHEILLFLQVWGTICTLGYIYIGAAIYEYREL